MTPDDVATCPHGRPDEQCVRCLREESSRRLDLLELAWGLIANAHGGDWNHPSALLGTCICINCLVEKQAAEISTLRKRAEEAEARVKARDAAVFDLGAERDALKAKVEEAERRVHQTILDQLDWFRAQILHVAHDYEKRYPKGKAVQNIVCMVLEPLATALRSRPAPGPGPSSEERKP